MLNDPVCYIRDSSFAYIYSVNVFYLFRYVRRSHSSGIHAYNGFLQLITHSLAFRNKLRLILTVTISGNVQDHIAQRSCFYCLGIVTVSAVAGVMTFFAVLLIAKMFFKLCFQHLFYTLLEYGIKE